jgi:hypothetical protein
MMKPNVWKKLVWIALMLMLVGAPGVGAPTGPAYAAGPDNGDSCSSQMSQGMMNHGGMMGSQGMMGQSQDKDMMNQSQDKDMMNQSQDKGMMGQSQDKGMMGQSQDKGMMGQSQDKGMMGDQGMMGSQGMMGDQGMMGSQGMMGDQSMMGQHDGQDGCGMGNYAAPWGRSYAIDPHRVMEMFLADLDPKLSVGVIIDLGSRYYAEAVEKDSGTGAYEATISRRDGTVWPEKGPNQLWNQKYGMLGTSVITGTETITPTAMSVTKDQAVDFARRYLTANKAGFTLDEAGRAFYGYYNFNVLKNGKPVSVISVNGYNGRVWYHSWLEATPRAAGQMAAMQGCADQCPHGQATPGSNMTMPTPMATTMPSNMPRPMPMETPTAAPTP